MTTEEVFLTISQHEAILVVKTGVKADGEFVARQSRVVDRFLDELAASPTPADAGKAR